MDPVLQNNGRRWGLLGRGELSAVQCPALPPAVTVTRSQGQSQHHEYHPIAKLAARRGSSGQAGAGPAKLLFNATH